MKQLRLKLLVLFLVLASFSMAQVHTTYLWHMQQPNYWPAQSKSNPNRYQTVKESFDLKMSGDAQNVYSDGLSHPLNDLEEIFSKDDRRNAYQQGPKNSVATLLGLPDAGAQVNYSGCLIENINSLAQAGQWGYYSGWQNNFVEAKNWKTSGNQSRMDMIGFTFHHALSPLVSERALAKELQAHKYISVQTFGGPYSKGYWPAECAFSERIIKVLVENGYEWSIVANSHLSRTLADYDPGYGTAGINISPPNKADKVSTNGNNWWQGQTDGRGGAFAAPYCYQVHKAKYVDPATGEEFVIDVVPMADLLSYKDGYQPMSTDDIDNYIAPFDNPSQPSLVLLAHDGDNAFAGGYSYYQESVPGFCNAAASKGYSPTTIQQFLLDHPVPTDDIVKVEDGAWVNAANDWGHPQFINWLWPLYDPTTYRFDPNGWTEDARNFAVITAAENFVCMAEDLAGGVDIADVVDPNSNSSHAEKAWHFFLPSLTSGYMYYGKALDMEMKQTIAGNIAIDHAIQEITLHNGEDNTPPSVFIPQRFPYNPGGKGFGPIYGYKEVSNSSDFDVWTFAFDVSGIQSAVVKYRTDDDGENPLTDNTNEVYAQGDGVSAWTSIDMTRKAFPKDNVANDPDIDFFELPTEIADLCYAEIAGITNTLLDYYVEITDIHGNVTKTAIQHVWVGEECTDCNTNDKITISPENPTSSDVITITVSDADANTILHWGVNNVAGNWETPITEYQASGSVLALPAIETPFTDLDGDGLYSVTVGPFSNPNQVVDNVAFVLKYSDTNWDNNGGSNYGFTIESTHSDNPTSANISISMDWNTTYSFTENDFTYYSPTDAAFAEMQITSIPSNGVLYYAGEQVVKGNEYSDLSLFSFVPTPDESASPYAQFTYKVKDSNGLYSSANYTVSINVISDAGITVHFKNTANWTNPKIHFWNVVPSGASTTWPGESMTNDDNDQWLDYTFNNATSLQFLFSNNGSSQTPDLTTTKEVWYEYGVGFVDSNSSPEIEVNPKGGSFKEGTSLEVIVSATDDGGLSPTIYYTLDGTEPTTSSASAVASVSLNMNVTTNLRAIAVDDSGKESAEINETYAFSTQSSFTVHVQGYSHIYFWGVTPSGETISWPGAAMQDSDSDSWLDYTFENAEFTNLLFNNSGNGKTADLTRDKDGWFRNGIWYDTKPEDPRGLILHAKDYSTVYFWNVQPTDETTTWPGETMQSEGDGWYTYTLEGASSANIIFSNNGGGQTENLFADQELWYESGMILSSKTSSISTNINSNSNIEMGIYPMPLTESSYLRVSNTSGEFSGSVMDMNGRMINKFEFSGNIYPFAKGDLTRGMYFVQIKNKKTGEIFKSKVVVY